jgi:hypothetical protein
MDYTLPSAQDVRVLFWHEVKDYTVRDEIQPISQPPNITAGEGCRKIAWIYDILLCTLSASQLMQPTLPAEPVSAV